METTKVDKQLRMSKSKQYERSYEANKSKDKFGIIYIMADHAQDRWNQSSKKIPTSINMSPFSIV